MSYGQLIEREIAGGLVQNLSVTKDALLYRFQLCFYLLYTIDPSRLSGDP